MTVALAGKKNYIISALGGGSSHVVTKQDRTLTMEILNGRIRMSGTLAARFGGRHEITDSHVLALSQDHQELLKFLVAAVLLTDDIYLQAAGDMSDYTGPIGIMQGVEKVDFKVWDQDVSNHSTAPRVVGMTEAEIHEATERSPDEDYTTTADLINLDSEATNAETIQREPKEGDLYLDPYSTDPVLYIQMAKA